MRSLFVLLICAFWTSEVAYSLPALKGRAKDGVLEFDDVMSNQRWRSVFWIYLYKNRLHENLSFWTEIETEIKPDLENRRAFGILDTLNFGNGMSDMPRQYRHVARKYLGIGSAASVTVQSDHERSVMKKLREIMSITREISSEESDKLFVILKEAQNIVKELLRKYHFVLFAASDPWNELKETTSVVPLLPSAGLQDHQPPKWNHIPKLQPGMNPVDAIIQFDMTAKDTFDSAILYSNGIDLPEDLRPFFDPQSKGEISPVFNKGPPDNLIYYTSFSCSDTPFYAAVLIRYVHSCGGTYIPILQKRIILHLYRPAGLMVISRYPVFETLKKRLLKVHQQALATDETYASNAKWQLTRENFWWLLQPWRAKGPELDLMGLLSKLTAEELVKLVGAVLLEKKIAILSPSFSMLTLTLEGLKLLIQPLVWSHVFSPTLPKCAIEALECPVPFLFGIHSSFIPEPEEMEKYSDVVFVNLSEGTITGFETPQLLLDLAKPLIFDLKQDEVSQEKLVEVFHNFIQQILRNAIDYRFRLDDGVEHMMVFDSWGFLNSVPSDDGFYKIFIKTVMFSQYIATTDPRIHFLTPLPLP